MGRGVGVGVGKGVDVAVGLGVAVGAGVALACGLHPVASGARASASSVSRICAVYCEEVEPAFAITSLQFSSIGVLGDCQYAGSIVLFTDSVNVVTLDVSEDLILHGRFVNLIGKA
jgi:hypothetical protein